MAQMIGLIGEELNIAFDSDNSTTHSRQHTAIQHNSSATTSLSSSWRKPPGPRPNRLLLSSYEMNVNLNLQTN